MSSRCPRPVADTPDADPAVIAKAWLVELVTSAPLDRAGDIPTAELAREAPALCAVVLAALRHDSALASLRPGGDRERLAARAAALAGAGDAASAVLAAEALRRAALATLAPAPGELAVAVADRLAHVCAVIAAGSASAAPALEAPPAAADPVLVARDERQAPAWVRAVEAAAARFAADRAPFAVIALEVDDAERLLAAQAAGEVDAALAGVQRALAAHLRPADELLTEAPGRHWLVVPDTTLDGARVLATQLTRAVADTSAHGVPLRLTAGLAACPRDGRSAETLLGAAEEGLFAARASGLSVS